MEKKQSDLCLEILRRFHNAGILDDLILIGSWCVYFYKDYFPSTPYIDQATIKWCKYHKMILWVLKKLSDCGKKDYGKNRTVPIIC